MFLHYSMLEICRSSALNIKTKTKHKSKTSTGIILIELRVNLRGRVARKLNDKPTWNKEKDARFLAPD